MAQALALVLVIIFVSCRPHLPVQATSIGAVSTHACQEAFSYPDSNESLHLAFCDLPTMSRKT